MGLGFKCPLRRKFFRKIAEFGTLFLYVCFASLRPCQRSDGGTFTCIYKKPELPQRWPRNAPWVSWKFSEVPEYAQSTPTTTFVKVLRAFVPINSTNVHTKFEVRSCNVWHPSAQRQCQDDNSIMNPIMSIVEPGRSRSAAPGLIIGLELSPAAGGVWVGLYKTHAGSLGVCLLSLMSFICRREQESSAT